MSVGDVLEAGKTGTHKDVIDFDQDQIVIAGLLSQNITKKLTEENKQLLIQSFEQMQKVEEFNDCLKHSNKESKAQKSRKLDFLNEVEYSDVDKERTIKELRAAHAETIQELQKTRNLLDIESKINKDYKVEVEEVLRK
ncbi:protein fantom [Thalassophryne amazonica]|uniref:protein fantom n=1 Tax=Thalassophryne amazonica TaxID=390379 RepID=UPI001470EC6F|nr:protein fantom [Thalassophryne amazonica]